TTELRVGVAEEFTPNLDTERQAIHTESVCCFEQHEHPHQGDPLALRRGIPCTTIPAQSASTPEAISTKCRNPPTSSTTDVRPVATSGPTRRAIQTGRPTTSRNQHE